MNWVESVRRALIAADPGDKCARVEQLREPAAEDLPPTWALDDTGVPGRPARPALVEPRSVPHRGFGSLEGRAALLHAVAHIEFNAINLALDACWRFHGMPQAYYREWLSVARDEARHFQMLSGRLVSLGFEYGDFQAHDGLWDAARKTSSDVLERMALVPRVLEARGLDVTPGLIAKLEQAGDPDSAAILAVILHEEVRHVAIGNHWFRHLCEERGVDPEFKFESLAARDGLRQRPPFNLEARAAAGFTQSELGRLSETRR